MKTYMIIVSMAVLTIAFGLAYADEIPTANKDVGTELYLSAFPINDTAMAVKDFGIAGVRPSEARVDVGTALYNDFLMKDTIVARSEAKGLAAGGMAKDDEKTRIWDHLLGAPGGSDLP